MKLIAVALSLVVFIIILVGCAERVSPPVYVPVNTTSLDGNHVVTLSGHITLEDSINTWIKANPDKVVSSISYASSGGNWVIATIVYRDKQ